MLVLREVLEASLFLSLLLVLGNKLGLKRIWLLPALGIGLLASGAESYSASWIAEQFDGIGQELLNAALFLIAMLSFILINAYLLPRAAREKPHHPVGYLGALFCLIVICSLAREGSEVWIYLSSFRGQAQALQSAAVGGLIGTGIGISLGALVYFLFSAIPNRLFFPLFFLLTTLVVCGLSMQLAKLGLQVGWLDSGEALWDSGALINEQTWIGQFLHALLGYDANPDRVQVGFYLGALLATGLACLIRYLVMAKTRASNLISSALILALALAPNTHAEISGVYSPYVNQAERELEYSIVFRGVGDRPISLQRLSASYAWNDQLAGELYVLSDTLSSGKGRLRGYEAEVLWQLGEQGQYWADLGLLFEYEHYGKDLRELSAGLLIERQLSQELVLSVNAFLEYEYRHDRQDELETAVYARLRYLYRRSLEPALELYLDDQDYALGPALLGSYRLAPGKQVRWSVGIPIGLTERSADVSLRAALEFEF